MLAACRKLQAKGEANEKADDGDNVKCIVG